MSRLRIVFLVLGLVPACQQAAGPAASGGGGGGTIPVLGHVFIVVEENTDYADVTSSSMPYLDSLAGAYASPRSTTPTHIPTYASRHNPVVYLTDVHDNATQATDLSNRSTLRLTANVLGPTSFPNQAATAPDRSEFFTP